MQLDRAIDYYHIPLSKVIIVLYVYQHLHRDLDWIDRLKIKYAKCYSIFQYKAWGINKIQYITLRKEIIKFKIDLLKLKFKIVGLYSSLYVDSAFVAYNLLGKPHFTLLDEGTASFGIILLRRKKVPIQFIIKESIAHLIIFRYPKKINYFSQYQLQIDNDDTIDNYEFKKTNNQLLLIDESVLLLGSSASEVNVMSESNYLLLVNSVRQRFSNSILSYYPHRFENENKLKQIQQLGFIIQENKVPFELLFSSLTECPKTVLCFGSPILGNILQMFTITPKCIMIKPHFDFYLKDASIYMDIYDHYTIFKEIEIWEVDNRDWPV